MFSYLRLYVVLLAVVMAGGLTAPLSAQIEEAPDRERGEGPYDHLIIRGATLINGSGAPPAGPVDIEIKDNRIADIHTVGFPGVPIDEDNRPEADENTREIDAEGRYILPGFVDLHGHIGGQSQGTPAEYVYKLWLAHGVTTIRDPGSSNGLEWTLSEKQRSETNEIAAPRIISYLTFGRGWDDPITEPDQARDWVRQLAEDGGDGIKFFSLRPDLMEAAIDEANARGIGTTAHLAQLEVARNNVLDAAEMGLESMNHWYGLPEAMLTDYTIQDYRLDYNYMNEQHRFAEAGKLWKEAGEPGSRQWEAARDRLLELDFTIVPTFNIYDANRDLMRAYRAEWHEEYTLPSLWEFFQPDRRAHGSYWFEWGTEEEIKWKENYRLWMKFINEYKNHGGRVAAGADSGFIFQTYGFGYIRELEMLREAGFHPLEVIRSATWEGAQELGMDNDIGTVEPGKKADLIIVDENPLQDLKVLYGTGSVRVDEENNPVRTNGIRYTIKDGIIYDAKQLLEDVRNIVDEEKAEKDYEIRMPGTQ